MIEQCNTCMPNGMISPDTQYQFTNFTFVIVAVYLTHCECILLFMMAKVATGGTGLMLEKYLILVIQQ